MKLLEFLKEFRRATEAFDFYTKMGMIRCKNDDVEMCPITAVAKYLRPMSPLSVVFSSCFYDSWGFNLGMNYYLIGLIARSADSEITYTQNRNANIVRKKMLRIINNTKKVKGGFATVK